MEWMRPPHLGPDLPPRGKGSRTQAVIPGGGVSTSAGGSAVTLHKPLIGRSAKVGHQAHTKPSKEPKDAQNPVLPGDNQIRKQSIDSKRAG